MVALDPRSTAQYKLVVVQEIVGTHARCLDSFGLTYTLSTSTRGKGLGPEKGDRWLIDRMYGAWAFAEYIGEPPIRAGHVMLWSTPLPPRGWLACNGALVDRIDQAALFREIGTTYNAGDEDDDVFRLPAWGGDPPISPLHIIKT